MKIHQKLQEDETINSYITNNIDIDILLCVIS